MTFSAEGWVTGDGAVLDEKLPGVFVSVCKVVADGGDPEGTVEALKKTCVLENASQDYQKNDATFCSTQFSLQAGSVLMREGLSHRTM